MKKSDAKEIIKILKEYDNVYLKIVGLLDLPEEMKEVKDKVITSPFVLFVKFRLFQVISSAGRGADAWFVPLPVQTPIA